MKSISGPFSLIAVLVALQAAPASGVEGAGPAAAGSPLEQQSFDDLAARLAEHLRATADLLVKIRGTVDPEERRKEIESYAVAMQTTNRLSQAMQVLAGSPRKDAAMGCAMMGARSAGETPKESAGSAGGAPDTKADSPASGGHEGHH